MKDIKAINNRINNLEAYDLIKNIANNVYNNLTYIQESINLKAYGNINNELSNGLRPDLNFNSNKIMWM
ncbi:MAG: hypothetical protein LBT10_06545 [Methanobrevibacter sp.]|jgi:hypothetical protein|nr:hypothetical protein [Methanobrevibacter sp.]